MKKIIIFLILVLPLIFSSQIWALSCEENPFLNKAPKSMGVGITFVEDGQYKLNILACSQESDCVKEIIFESNSYEKFDEIGYYLVKDWDGALAGLPERIKEKDYRSSQFTCGCPDYKTSFEKLERKNLNTVPNLNVFKPGVVPKYLRCKSQEYLKLLSDRSSAKSVIYGRIEFVNGTYFLKVDAGKNTKRSIIKIKNNKEMKYVDKGMLQKSFALFTSQTITGNEKEIDSISLCNSIYDVSINSDEILEAYPPNGPFYIGITQNGKSENITLNFPPLEADYKYKKEIIEISDNYFNLLTNELKFKKQRQEELDRKIATAQYRYDRDPYFKIEIDNDKVGNLKSKFKRFYKKSDLHMKYDVRKDNGKLLKSMMKEKFIKGALLTKIKKKAGKYYLDLLVDWNGLKKRRYILEHFSMDNRHLDVINKLITRNEYDRVDPTFLILSSEPIKLKNGNISLPQHFQVREMGNDNHTELNEIFIKYFASLN